MLVLIEHIIKVCWQIELWKKQKGTLANLPKDIFRKTTVKVCMEDTTSHAEKLSLVRESSISHDTDFGALLPGPDLWLCHLLAMKSWVVFLNYLCFSFPICKMEIMREISLTELSLPKPLLLQQQKNHMDLYFWMTLCALYKVRPFITSPSGWTELNADNEVCQTIQTCPVNSIPPRTTEISSRMDSDRKGSAYLLHRVLWEKPVFPCRYLFLCSHKCL